jgi:hypothetical protein
VLTALRVATAKCDVQHCRRDGSGLNPAVNQTEYKNVA